MLTVINIIFQNKHLFPLFLCTTSLVTLRMLSLFQCKYCPCRWLIWLLHCSSRNRNHLFNFLALAIRFCHPRHNGQWPPTLQPRISIPDFIHYIIFLSLFFKKRLYFPFLLLSAKQGNYWYHFITSLVWRDPWRGIEPLGPPALEASTLPLGYRGGGLERCQIYFGV